MNEPMFQRFIKVVSPLFTGLLLCSSVSADIVKCVGTNGVVMYQNTSCKPPFKNEPIASQARCTIDQLHRRYNQATAQLSKHSDRLSLIAESLSEDDRLQLLYKSGALRMSVDVLSFASDVNKAEILLGLHALLDSEKSRFAVRTYIDLQKDDLIRKSDRLISSVSYSLRDRHDVPRSFQSEISALSETLSSFSRLRARCE
jgi:hypothetical protein